MAMNIQFLTPLERHAALMLLAKASKRIQDGWNVTVCGALRDSRGCHLSRSDEIAYMVIRRTINASLEGMVNLAPWLYSKGVLSQHLTPDNMKTFRLHWLDEMISEISEYA